MCGAASSDRAIGREIVRLMQWRERFELRQRRQHRPGPPEPGPRNRAAMDDTVSDPYQLALPETRPLPVVSISPRGSVMVRTRSAGQVRSFSVPPSCIRNACRCGLTPIPSIWPWIQGCGSSPDAPNRANLMLDEPAMITATQG